jgi:hypothetical protein
MTMRSSVRDAMLAAVPSLRAFAISLCGNVDRADDLVQETKDLRIGSREKNLPACHSNSPSERQPWSLPRILA